MTQKKVYLWVGGCVCVWVCSIQNDIQTSIIFAVKHRICSSARTAAWLRIHSFLTMGDCT